MNKLHKNSGTELATHYIQAIRKKEEYGMDSYLDSCYNIERTFTKFRKLEIQHEKEVSFLLSEAKYYISGGKYKPSSVGYETIHIPPERVIGALMTWRSLSNHLDLGWEDTIETHIQDLRKIIKAKV